MKNARRTASLEVLDEYAKKLTKKQASMLYEAKMNKKYTKRLYEDTESQYSMYIDDFLLDEAGVSLAQLRRDVIKPLKLNETIVTGGINICTSDKNKYINMVNRLADLGFDDETLDEISDDRI